MSPLLSTINVPRQAASHGMLPVYRELLFLPIFWNAETKSSSEKVKADE
jgi:hypothetical protein